MKFEPGAAKRLAIGLPIVASTAILDQVSKWLILLQTIRKPRMAAGCRCFRSWISCVAWNHGVSFSMGTGICPMTG